MDHNEVWVNKNFLLDQNDELIRKLENFVKCPRCKNTLRCYLRKISTLDKEECKNVCEHCLNRYLFRKASTIREKDKRSIGTEYSPVKYNEDRVKLWLLRIIDLLESNLILYKTANLSKQAERRALLSIESRYKTRTFHEPKLDQMFDFKIKSTQRKVKSEEIIKTIKRKIRYADDDKVNIDDKSNFEEKTDGTPADTLRDDATISSTDSRLKQTDMLQEKLQVLKRIIFRDSEDLDTNKGFDEKYKRVFTAKRRIFNFKQSDVRELPNRVESETKLQNVRKNLSTTSIKQFNSLESLTSISGLPEKMFEHNFSYFFPKTELVKKPITHQISSSEIIKDTIAMLSERAELEKKKKDEERKQKSEEEENKRIVRLEKLKQKVESAIKFAAEKNEVTFSTEEKDKTEAESLALKSIKSAKVRQKVPEPENIKKSQSSSEPESKQGKDKTKKDDLTEKPHKDKSKRDTGMSVKEEPKKYKEKSTKRESKKDRDKSSKEDLKKERLAEKEQKAKAKEEKDNLLKMEKEKKIEEKAEKEEKIRLKKEENEKLKKEKAEQLQKEKDRPRKETEVKEKNPRDEKSKGKNLKDEKSKEKNSNDEKSKERNPNVEKSIEKTIIEQGKKEKVEQPQIETITELNEKRLKDEKGKEKNPKDENNKEKTIIEQYKKEKVEQPQIETITELKEKRLKDEKGKEKNPKDEKSKEKNSKDENNKEKTIIEQDKKEKVEQTQIGTITELKEKRLKDEKGTEKTTEKDDKKRIQEMAERKLKAEAFSKMTAQDAEPATKSPSPTLKKQEKTTFKELSISRVKLKKHSQDNLILQLVKLKQSEQKQPRKEPELSPILFRAHQDHNALRDSSCILFGSSDLEMDADIINGDRKIKDPTEVIMGQKIVKVLKSPRIGVSDAIEPLVFRSTYLGDEPKSETDRSSPPASKRIDPEATKGVIRYALSDRSFIDKGWTMLPTEKVVRKMNVYRMRPAHPEFDWFEHNKSKKLMHYDTGEKLAEFDDDGKGRWYYRNGRLALDYYDAEETNAQQRFVIYSNGEPDERGRPRPFTIIATFDYLGNGVVFDHRGKIRLKYNQTEGVVLDKSIGPVSHWKWHTLNDPPVLQQVMIDTQMSHKDPEILKLGGQGDQKPRQDNEEMLAIEFDNFIKEKSKKLTQKFKPFQIKMKALKINENFSLKVLDQATVYLIFRDSSTNLKLNIGMILDHKEIVDTDTAEVGEVSNSLERFPAKTDSLAGLQNSVAHAQHVERARVERERRLRPSHSYTSADKLMAAASKPLQQPFRTTTIPSTSNPTTTTICRCKYRKPSTCNIYYDTRLV